MTFIINRKQLADELALLNTVAGKGEANRPILNYVKLSFTGTVLTLAASNVDVSLVTEIEATGEPWEGCLHCAQLYGLVKLIDQETVTIKIGDGPVQLKAGRSKHLLPTARLEEFPIIEHVKADQITIPAPLLNSMIADVSFATMIPADDLKPSQARFTGISLIMRDGVLRLTGTNIVRLATVTTAIDPSIVSETIIPPNAIDVLLNLKQGEVGLSITERFIHVQNGVRQLTIQRFNDDKFPDWQSMFPAKYEHETQIATSELGAAIKRTMLTQNEGRMVIIGQRWTWANDELLIETRNGDKGKSDEVVPVTGLNGSSVTLGMNGRQVLDVLSRLGDTITCRFSAGTNVVELTPKESTIGFRYYINTVSLRHWE